MPGQVDIKEPRHRAIHDFAAAECPVRWTLSSLPPLPAPARYSPRDYGCADVVVLLIIIGK